jgi:predicted transcriptional regulator
MDEQDTHEFAEDQLAMIDQGLAEFERGEGVSAEEALKLAKERTKAWMNVTAQSLSA